MSFVPMFDPDEERPDPYYQRIAASEMASACRFAGGSLRCINDPCPNPNHRGTNE